MTEPGRGGVLHDEPERSGHIPVSGGRVWYRLDGARHLADEERTPVLGIHGGPGMSHDYLLPLVDLADERPVILYDQLDSGNSERPNDPANWTVARFVSEIDSLRAALALDRVIVFGNSWGGTLAAEYAMTRPEGLAALVLSSPLISTKRWLADNEAHRNRLPDAARATLNRHEAAGTTDNQDYRDAVAVFMRRHFNRMDVQPEELARSFGAFNVDVYNTMWGNTEFNATGILKDYDASARLARIQVPTLYTCGAFDESTPAANEDFARLTPGGAEVVVFSDASHTAFLERRGPYIAALRAFFARVVPDPARPGGGA